MNIALQKLKQTEDLILGQVKQKIKTYLKTQYANIPYEYALLKESNKELIDNSYIHLNNELLSDMDGKIFKNLAEENYITLIYYHFKDTLYYELRIIGDVEYKANYKLINELKQEAVEKIIKTSRLENFSNIVVYLNDKCTQYNLQDEYLNFLDYAKKCFLQQEEKKINDIILTESTRMKVQKEENQNLLLEKQEKNKKVKTYLKQKENTKVEKELEV